MRDLSNTEELHAQHIACGHLVKGYEGAMSDFQAMPGETNDRPRTRKRAEEILAQVLSSWRHAMSAVGATQEPLWHKDSLDVWTSDELFAETLVRRAGDGSALRLMQTLTLNAQLIAHDREPVVSELTN